MSELIDGLTEKQRKRLWEGKCADCDGNLLAGPHGGMSINYMCEKCKNRFNVCIIKNTFAESGAYELLLAKYGMDVPSIVKAARQVINRKK